MCMAYNFYYYGLTPILCHAMKHEYILYVHSYEYIYYWIHLTLIRLSATFFLCPPVTWHTHGHRLSTQQQTICWQIQISQRPKLWTCKFSSAETLQSPFSQMPAMCLLQPTWFVDMCMWLACMLVFLHGSVCECVCHVCMRVHVCACVSMWVQKECVNQVCVHI